MCGITGSFTFRGHNSNQRQWLEKAVQGIAHRGPDNQGTYIDPHVALGHTRLSIIDVSEKGNQPMKDDSGDFVLIYNGECYNHLELREVLKNKGIQFQSSSDTETVLYWLRENGADGLKDINGFFALAFYDKIDKKLLLARDRFGIKPLYYKYEEKDLIFGSELSSIQDMAEGFSMNIYSLQSYLHLNYIPAPYSIYNEVYKLLPGTYMSVNITGKTEMHRYFDLEYVSGKKKAKPSTIEEKLDESVRKRLMSDVPIGSFLSGGIDSSIITGLAARHIDKLNTYTIVFKGSKQYDESPDARIVAKHFNTDHHEIEINANDLPESVSAFLSNVSEPFADSSALAVYNLCKGISPEVKVALAGDGGDELFAGYYKHLAMHYAFKFPRLSKAAAVFNPLINMLPSSREAGVLNSFRKWQRYASASLMDPVDRYWSWAGYGNPIKDLISQNDLSPALFMQGIHYSPLNTLDECLRMDIAMVLEGDMLVKTDRMGMRNGIEVRVPFLDHEFVQFVSKIPASQKLKGNRKKKLLKDSFTHMLPKEILNKKKQGFEIPLKHWLNHELSDKVNELLNPEFLKEQNIFNPQAVANARKLMTQRNSSNAEYTVWSLMVFNAWWKKNRNLLKS